MQKCRLRQKSLKRPAAGGDVAEDWRTRWKQCLHITIILDVVYNGIDADSENDGMILDIMIRAGS